MCKLSWSYIRQVSKEIKLFIFRSPWWDSLVHSRSDHKCSTPIVRSDQNNAPPKERPLSQKSLCQGIGIVIASNSNHLSFLYIISFSVCVRVCPSFRYIWKGESAPWGLKMWQKSTKIRANHLRVPSGPTRSPTQQPAETRSNPRWQMADAIVAGFRRISTARRGRFASKPISFDFYRKWRHGHNWKTRFAIKVKIISGWKCFYQVWLVTLARLAALLGPRMAHGHLLKIKVLSDWLTILTQPRKGYLSSTDLFS